VLEAVNNVSANLAARRTEQILTGAVGLGSAVTVSAEPGETPSLATSVTEGPVPTTADDDRTTPPPHHLSLVSG
jgi:hypothetical protein